MRSCQLAALERDANEWGSYNRLLVCVNLADGTWINGLMVAESFARAKIYEPDARYTSALRELEAQAEAAGERVREDTPLPGQRSLERFLLCRCRALSRR